MFGKEVANVLMEHLPPTGWADVATKADLDHAVALLRTELHAEVAGLCADFTGLRAENRAEIAGLRGDIHREMARQTRTIMLGMVGWFTTLFGTMIGVVASLPH